MKTKIFAAAAMAWAVAVASPAMAQNVEARDPAGVEAALTAAGYPGKVETGSSGSPIIKVKTDSLSFLVSFTGCKENKNCTSVAFFTAFASPIKPTLQAVNNWNSNKRFGRVYTDNEGDPVIQMDLDLDDGGMSRGLFIDNVEWFTVVANDVRKELVKK
jgi:hypothetical protein